MALSILVVGLEERRQQMMLRQPSVGRIFELVDLAPWSPEEVREFYRSRLSAEAARVSPAGLDLLAAYTGGLPVLAHEIGDAIWRRQGARHPRPRDPVGIFTAAEIVGRKFLRPQVFSAIRSGVTTPSSGKMADKPTLHVDRAALRERLSEDERKVLDNFLRRMTKLGALSKDPEVRGRYRFPNSLHALYFWMESERRRRAGGKLRRAVAGTHPPSRKFVEPSASASCPGDGQRRRRQSSQGAVREWRGQPSTIPRRLRAKSYFVGSCGSRRARQRVRSRAACQPGSAAG